MRVPSRPDTRSPRAVLLHGSGGIVASVDDGVQLLDSMGVATFVIDGITATGISRTFDDQGQHGRREPREVT